MESNNQEIIVSFTCTLCNLSQELLEKERQRIENIYTEESEDNEDYPPEEYSSDEEEIDHNNYKGIYAGDEPGQKFTDPITGAHFEFDDMCSRLERVEADRNSLDARVSNQHKLLDDDEEFGIYKTQEQKKRIIRTKSNKNKEDIIKQLNQKITFAQNYGENRNKMTQKQVKNKKNKEGEIIIGDDPKHHQGVYLNDPETVSSIATKGGQLPTQKSQFDQKSFSSQGLRDTSTRYKAAQNLMGYQNIISMANGLNSFDNSKAKYRLQKRDKSFGSMIQLGDFNSSKNYYHNTSVRARHSLSSKNDKLIKKSHSKSSHCNNIILENTKPTKNRRKKRSSGKKRSKERSKEKNISDLILAISKKYKLKKSVKGSKHGFHIPIKKSLVSGMKNSRDRSTQRSKSKKTKWKSSPYKKKMATKFQKFKTMMNDTPERKRHSRNSNMRISEYTNFMQGARKKSSLKRPMSKKKVSHDFDRFKTFDRKYSRASGDHLRKILSKGKSRNRSKTKNENYSRNVF
ncbi:unnamed protein product [Moneuplotes crassus]|uniref:Uncharacterized protein n=1 Tax=Euplotes crassus TaxID=5936 RepID=A0AAD1UD68_EUPCR|nr:unnamed protein product [Moneuplotes crassus]